MRGVVRELLRLRVQQRRTRTLHALYESRTQKLRARATLLESVLDPLSLRFEAHRGHLLQQSLLAATSEARRGAQSELDELKELMRSTAAKSEPLDAYAASYDSDEEVRESPKAAVVVNADGTVKKQRRPRQLHKLAPGVVRGPPNNGSSKKKADDNAASENVSALSAGPDRAF